MAANSAVSVCGFTPGPDGGIVTGTAPGAGAGAGGIPKEVSTGISQFVSGSRVHIYSAGSGGLCETGVVAGIGLGKVDFTGLNAVAGAGGGVGAGTLTVAGCAPEVAIGNPAPIPVDCTGIYILLEVE